MKYPVLFLPLFLLSAPAFAEDAAAPAGGMDMSKMGPWTRKPTNEKATKKEITAFFMAEEELTKKGDFEGILGHIDFPVYMFTDDAKGTPETNTYDREKYSAMMKPFYDNMPKDVKTTHKPTVVVLSDSLVTFTDDFVITMGKTKMTGRNAGVLVKIAGNWKWKVMGEAGWGGMEKAPEAGAQAKADTKPAPAAPAAPAKK